MLCENQWRCQNLAIKFLRKILSVEMLNFPNKCTRSTYPRIYCFQQFNFALAELRSFEIKIGFHFIIAICNAVEFSSSYQIGGIVEIFPVSCKITGESCANRNNLFNIDLYHTDLRIASPLAIRIISQAHFCYSLNNT